MVAKEEDLQYVRKAAGSFVEKRTGMSNMWSAVRLVYRMAVGSSRAAQNKCLLLL